jgi:hypothetical protein
MKKKTTLMRLLALIAVAAAPDGAAREVAQSLGAPGAPDGKNALGISREKKGSLLLHTYCTIQIDSGHNLFI